MNSQTQEKNPVSTQVRNEELWRMAKRRAAFKTSLLTYFIMNCFFIAIWYFSSGVHSYFWPIWPMLGWGLGVALQYFKAYQSFAISSAEGEYEKLINQTK